MNSEMQQVYRRIGWELGVSTAEDDRITPAAQRRSVGSRWAWSPRAGEMQPELRRRPEPGALRHPGTQQSLHRWQAGVLGEPPGEGR